MSSARIPEAVKRVFMEAFTARDVAEPLASFDAATPSRDVCAFMKAQGFDVIGIRGEGRMVGYADCRSLDGGALGGHRRPFDDATVLDDGASLPAVIAALTRAELLFVRVLGQVGGIITRDDLQKPAVRMWLFGLVTLIEMRWGELIERHCPGDSWMRFLSEGRIEKARTLLAERRRRNQSLELLDCLQFSDKGQVVARNEALRKHTMLASRRQVEETCKRLEQLRNNLAHAQDILACDWETIVELCAFVSQPRTGEGVQP